MDDEATQPSTQQVLDPRRLGRNNSGLSEPDISDVLCILHPSSPAAFRVVKLAAQRSPQHVLQNQGLGSSMLDSQSVNAEEQETFILGAGRPGDIVPTDLALRFSSKTVCPILGFTFGRNPNSCDIVFDIDVVKRVSNLHFRIYVNPAGVVMLQDVSTNGTLVDGILLRAKDKDQPATRMLNPGSIIMILSPNENEVIKFILRIPSRDGHIADYSAKFQAYMQRLAEAEQNDDGATIEALKKGRRGQLPHAALPLAGIGANKGAPVKPSIVSANYTYGMVWDGGPEYNVTGLLGKGAFAMVYRLATALDGKVLAAKELEKKRFIKNGQLDQKLDNEMKIMKTLRHPNIVQYIDYRDVQNHLYIIMEYVPCGDLQGYLADHKVLSESAAKCVAAQILDALAYLHHKKITHRDIKPDNILIASEDPFVVKLSDFGLSKVVTNNETFLKTFCGTLLYCAPEVFPHYDGSPAKKGTKRRRGSSSRDYHSYSQSVDIWSFAAVLWYAMCGKPPFEGVIDGTGRGMFERIMNTRLDPEALLKRGVSAQAVDLLLKMLTTDPSQRPTERECLRHPWLADIVKEHPQYGQYDLNAITEEAEDHEQAPEEQAEVQLSQLSIHGRREGSPIWRPGDTEHVDWESQDLEYLDPRESKRVRPDLLMPRNQIRDSDALNSSAESSFQAANIEKDARSFALPAASTPGGGRLFGEIAQSALQSSGLLGQHTNTALEMAQHDGPVSELSRDTGDAAHKTSFNRQIDVSYPDLPPTTSMNSQQAAGSLLGAESMMRDINMGDSPLSANSPANEPPTPRTPDFSQASTGADQARTQDITPKPQVSSFSRRIKLSRSSFEEGEMNQDLPFSTTGAEYADLASSGSIVEDSGLQAPLATALPATMHPSLSALASDGPVDDIGMTAGAADTRPPDNPAVGVEDASQSSEFRRPPPRLGKLTSTASSAGVKELPLTLRLEHRVTTWGRDPSNTHVFPDPLNVRIPKRGIVIYFHDVGIEKLEKDGGDVTKMAGLHTLITTFSKIGIWVNGVKLRLEEDGKTQYGKLYTGDIITVYKDPSAGGAKLEFTCEFFHGEAVKTRPAGEPFKVLKA